MSRRYCSEERPAAVGKFLRGPASSGRVVGPRWNYALAACLALGLAADRGRLAAAEPLPLKEAFQDDFLVGVALHERHIFDRDPQGVALVRRHFNAIAPENVMKWERIHPRPGPDGYRFEAADRYVEFGERHGMFIVGHTLVWHSQTPRWVFADDQGVPVSRAVLLERMRDHIHTVVGRYRGRINAWDVVNEALDEDGSLRKSPWLQIIGEEYLAHAFQFAHEADPQAELRYNDYSLENEPKRRGAVALVKRLQAQGIPISGLGSQTHANLAWPSPELLDATLTEFAPLGLPISITELDVTASRGGQRRQTAEVGRAAADGDERAPEALRRQAEQYGRLFRVFLKHRAHLKQVTFWGVTDRDSWRRGGTPLLFDEAYQPKPAFEAVLEAAREPRASLGPRRGAGEVESAG